MRGNKGFTLIELLAVILILVIIILISVPIILGVIEKARKGTAEASARNYLVALDNYFILSKMDPNLRTLDANTKYNVTKSTTIGNTAYESINKYIKIKGYKPSGLDDYLTLDERNSVIDGKLTISGYEITIKNDKIFQTIKVGKIEVESLSLSMSETSMEVGTSFTLNPIISPINASDQRVTYSSSDSSIVSVNELGKVTANKIGSATITATSLYDNKKQATITVDVILSATGITLNKENSTIVLGNSETLVATLIPSNTTTSGITWTSDPAGIVSIDNGVVTAIGAGTTVINATTTNGKTASATIEVITIYKDNILNGADPVLGNNIIPVKVANDGTVTYANIYNKWYDYTNKIWANAVKLSSGTYNVGDIIPETAIESYFVWIPRYKYKIFDIGNYSGVISGKPATGREQTIDIVFESKDIAPLNGTTVNSYLTHPAFTTLNVNGMWVGKFETGYKGATSTTSAEVTSTDSSKIIVKPNVFSWRNNTIYNIFLSSYNYDRTNDSHMMKNTEWGAVAYLSHSNYGINKEINVNNNSLNKTGFSALASTNQAIYPGAYGDAPTYNDGYNTTTGYLASTTGNISGIYDMSGGAWEYMASYISGKLGSSGFTTASIASYNSKYFDVYSASSTGTSFNNRILGDATGEIGPFNSYADSDSYVRNHSSWYSDFPFFAESSYPWFNRGGRYMYGVFAGIFTFNRDSGDRNNYNGSRLVLTD